MGKRMDMLRDFDTSTPEHAKAWKRQLQLNVLGVIVATLFVVCGLVQHVAWWTVVGAITWFFVLFNFWLLSRTKPAETQSSPASRQPLHGRDTGREWSISPSMGKILFFVMLVFLAVAVYATAAFAITKQGKYAATWAVLSVGALIGLWSYWRTWHKK